MRDTVSFVLLREGSSDDGLLAHLRLLLVEAGVREANGSSRPYKGTVEERLRGVLAEPGTLDLVFIHRDADGPDASARYREIVEAAATCGAAAPCVGVVPIQETEAWLLVDEDEIRRVVGRRKGNEPLGLPNLNRIEQTTNPKEVLEAALLAASATTGRRRDREVKRFSEHRRVLLERLDVHGPVKQLGAFAKLMADIETTTKALAARSPG